MSDQSEIGSLVERSTVIGAPTRKFAEELLQAFSTLSRSLEMEAVLETLLDELSAFIPYDRAQILLVEGGGKRAEVRAARGDARPVRPEDGQAISLGLDEPGILADLLASRRSLLFDEPDQFPRWLHAPAGDPARGWLGLPLLAGDEVIGFCLLGEKQPSGFREDHLLVADALAGVAAYAIRNALSYEAERNHRREVETLQEAAISLTAHLDLEQVLNSMLAHLERVAPYDHAMVVLIEEETLNFVARAGDGRFRPVEPRRPPLSAELLTKMQRSWSPLIIEDARADRRLSSEAVNERVRGWMGVPLVVRGEVIGYLTLASRQAGVYDGRKAILAQGIANQAAVAIQNAQLFEQIRSSRERMQALSRRLVEVQEAERQNIARELHDQIGQILTGLKLILDMSIRLPSEGLKQNLGEAQSLVNELMARVRELSLDLRPAMLDDLGLLPALLWLFERYTTQTRVEVRFKHTGVEGRRFQADVETAAYRIVQEALTNVARHSFSDQVMVRMWADRHTLAIQIEDRGKGFDQELAQVANPSSGISGMRERAVLLGGRLIIESAPGSGTLLTAELPLSGRIERRRKRR